MESTKTKITRWVNTILKSEWIKKNGEPKVILLEVLNLMRTMYKEKAYTVKSDSVHSLNYSKYNAIINLCDLLGIEVIAGNDGPQGGKLSDYLLIGDKDAYAWGELMRKLTQIHDNPRYFYIDMAKLKEVLNKYKN